MIVPPWFASALAGAASVAAMGALGTVRVTGASQRLVAWADDREAEGALRSKHRLRGSRVSARVGALVGLAVGLCLPFPGKFLAPFLCFVGTRVPAIVDRRASSRLRARMDAQIPQLLDLLAAASSAGLSGQLAFRRAVEALGGPLAEELAGALDAVDLGGRWREELALVARRLGLPDLRRAVVALSRTETLGASLADSTAELAASVRAARRAAITERARTAPVKMLFPLVFLVLPAFLLLTVVPVLLTTLQSIR